MRKIKVRDGIGGAALGLAAVLCLLLLPTSASATTGAIEGLSIEPSLQNATIENLNVAFDRCSSPENAGCAWSAKAYLVSPPGTSCPPTSSWLTWFEENPPGLPGGPTLTEVWSRSASGDGTIESGPLLLPLGGINDQYICLYATSSVPIGEPSSGPGTPPPDTIELLASQSLHVDQPPSEETQPANPAPSLACKKHQVRRYGRCKKKARRHHRHRHRRDR